MASNFNYILKQMRTCDIIIRFKISGECLAAVSAREGLFNTGLRQLQDACDGMEKTGKSQLTIRLNAMLGEVLLVHGKTRSRSGRWGDSSSKRT